MVNFSEHLLKIYVIYSTRMQNGTLMAAKYPRLLQKALEPLVYNPLSLSLTDRDGAISRLFEKKIDKWRLEGFKASPNICIKEWVF